MTAFRDIIQSRQDPARSTAGTSSAPAFDGPAEVHAPPPARATARSGNTAAPPVAAPWRAMRQRQAARWAADAPAGQNLSGTHHRAMRLLIEALELARLSGLNEAQMQAMLSATFSREAGDAGRAAGGVGVALLMVCDALQIDAEDAEVAELNRIFALLQPQKAPSPPRMAPPRANVPAAPVMRPAPPRRQSREELQEDLRHEPY